MHDTLHVAQACRFGGSARITFASDGHTIDVRKHSEKLALIFEVLQAVHSQR